MQRLMLANSQHACAMRNSSFSVCLSVEDLSVNYSHASYSLHNASKELHRACVYSLARQCLNFSSQSKG